MADMHHGMVSNGIVHRHVSVPGFMGAHRVCTRAPYACRVEVPERSASVESTEADVGNADTGSKCSLAFCKDTGGDQTDDWTRFVGDVYLELGMMGATRICSPTLLGSRSGGHM